jgi:hypothetical protein
MIPPLQDTGESEYQRFKRLGQALLAVSKAEIQPEETLAKLEAEKRQIDAKLAEVHRVLKKRRSAKFSSRS